MNGHYGKKVDYDEITAGVIIATMEWKLDWNVIITGANVF